MAFPHGNCRAEVGVKTIKRLITDNVGPGGTLNIDGFQKAILQYRNTPGKDTKLSPAMCIYGRPIKDLIPILPGRYKPHQVWQESLLAREEALRKRHMANHERWKEHTRFLPPLSVGDHVRIQNQMGNHPKRWDKTGVVIEVRQYHQYVIRMDGSGRVTIRNRKFLRKYTPVHQDDRRRCILDDLTYLPTDNSPGQSSAPITPTDVSLQPSVPLLSTSPKAPTSPPPVDSPLLTAQLLPPNSPRPSFEPPPSTPAATSPPLISSPQIPNLEASSQSSHAEPESPPIKLRRSSRIRKPPKWHTSNDFVLY